MPQFDESFFQTPTYSSTDADRCRLNAEFLHKTLFLLYVKCHQLRRSDLLHVFRTYPELIVTGEGKKAGQAMEAHLKRSLAATLKTFRLPELTEAAGE